MEPNEKFKDGEVTTDEVVTVVAAVDEAAVETGDAKPKLNAEVVVEGGVVTELAAEVEPNEKVAAEAAVVVVVDDVAVVALGDDTLPNVKVSEGLTASSLVTNGLTGLTGTRSNLGTAETSANGFSCFFSASFCSSSLSKAESSFSTRFSSRLRSCSSSLVEDISGFGGLLAFSTGFSLMEVLTMSEIRGKLILVPPPAEEEAVAGGVTVDV